MNKFFKIFFLCIFCLSCSSDLNFDQVNELNLEPVVIANLASFDVQANQFVIGGIEQTVTGDLMDFDVFRKKNFSKNLTRADFFFEINNTINRSFRVDLYLLDANNNTLYTISLDVPVDSTGKTPVTKTEVFENAKLNLLKSTSKIAFVVSLLPGPTLSENSLGSLKMRSSATLYFVIE